MLQPTSDNREHVFIHDRTSQKIYICEVQIQGIPDHDDMWVY